MIKDTDDSDSNWRAPDVRSFPAEPRPYRSYLHDLEPQARARFDQLMGEYELTGTLKATSKTRRLNALRRKQAEQNPAEQNPPIEQNPSEPNLGSLSSVPTEEGGVAAGPSGPRPIGRRVARAPRRDTWHGPPVPGPGAPVAVVAASPHVDSTVQTYRELWPDSAPFRRSLEPPAHDALDLIGDVEQGA